MGLFSFKLERDESPLVIYTLDGAGRISDDIILIHVRYTNPSRKAHLALSASQNYQFTRGELLDRPYDSSKTPLTESQFNSLRRIYRTKLEDLLRR
jgi:hypothetical protein